MFIYEYAQTLMCIWILREREKSWRERAEEGGAGREGKAGREERDRKERSFHLLFKTFAYYFI